MTSDAQWERLLDHIAEWGHARETSEGLEVTFEQPYGAARTVKLIVTPEDWSDYVATIYGTADPSTTPVKATIMATPVGTDYVVYNTYDWIYSATPQPPEELADPGPGEWTVIDSAGDVHRFADFDED